MGFETQNEKRKKSQTTQEFQKLSPEDQQKVAEKIFGKDRMGIFAHNVTQEHASEDTIIGGKSTGEDPVFAIKHIIDNDLLAKKQEDFKKALIEMVGKKNSVEKNESELSTAAEILTEIQRLEQRQIDFDPRRRDHMGNHQMDSSAALAGKSVEDTYTEDSQKLEALRKKLRDM